MKKVLVPLAALYYELEKRVGKDVAATTTMAFAREITANEQRKWYIPRAGEHRSWEEFHRNHEYQMAHGIIKYNEKAGINKEPTKYSFVITRCLFYEVLKDMNMAWLTEAFCSSDETVFNEYLPAEMRFHRGDNKVNTIVRGAQECVFIFEKTY